MDKQDQSNKIVTEVASSVARGFGRVVGMFAASAGICAVAGGGIAWGFLGSSFALLGAAVGAALGVAICVLIFYILNA